MSQTQGTLTLVTTNLVHANANELGFLTRIAPSSLVWADPGSLPNNTSRFLRPETAAAINTGVFITVNQPLVINQVSIQARIAPGVGNTDTFYVRKNGVDTPFA